VINKLFTTRNLVILLLVIALFVVSGLLGLKVVLPEVSIAAEPVLHIGSFTITNSLLTAWLAMVILIVIALLATRHIPRDLATASNQDLVPAGLQNVVEMLVDGFYGIVKTIGGAWAPRFFPIVMTIFLFVVLSNWLGLVPGFGSIGLLEHPHNPDTTGYVARGVVLTAERAPDAHEGYILVPFFRAPSTDLNFTLALALASVALSQYFGIQALRLGYFKRFFNLGGFKDGALMGIAELLASMLELIAEFAKIISFSFRLFGNIFAGEVLLGVVAFLIPYIVSLPFYGLEVFVGFIQAVVFMMLTLVFFASATAGHGGEEHH
jgi:F-type H+-transporting ATPase subunit a